ncbi:hypothetical protein UlMin_004118 [Ulmus minor]
MSTTRSGLSSSSSSVGASDATLIPNLHHLNHTFLRSQMDNVIFANGFEDFIEGSSVYPEKTIQATGLSNSEFIAWRRQDRLILSWIYSSLTTEIMAQIIVRIMQLRLQLQTTRKNSMSMMEYTMKLKSFSDSLAAIGEPVSEQDQIMNLLGGLGADYNAVVTSINVRDDKISIDMVHCMLLSFKNHLEQQNYHDENSLIAGNIAQNKSNGGRTYYKNSQGYQRSQGHSSNSANHQNFYSRNRGRSSRGGQAGRNNNNNNRPQCQLCCKFGHTVHSCYHRFDTTFQAQTSTNQTHNQGQISAMVVTPHSVGDESWFLDLGATHHLTQTSAKFC